LRAKARRWWCCRIGSRWWRNESPESGKCLTTVTRFCENRPTDYNSISLPMPLATRLAFQFDKRVQIKGLNLFHGRAVRVISHGANHLFAEVKGSKLYDVRLRY